MKRADLVVRNIGLLATLAGTKPRSGAAARELGVVEQAALAAAGGRIVYAGAASGLEDAVEIAADTEVLDAAGAAVVPGLVDPHTHLAYAGERDDELRQRLAGVAYADIAAAGGGIVKTVGATRGASLQSVQAPRRRGSRPRNRVASRPARR